MHSPKKRRKLPEIDFRGIKLGATLAQVQEMLGLDPYKPETFCGTDLSDIMFDFCWFAAPKYMHPENPDCFLYGEIGHVDSNRNIAGHDAAWTELYFVRRTDDGEVSANDAEAVFYAGSYSFDAFSGNDIDAIIDDLEKKLTVLYGVPEKQKSNGGNALVWYGADDTAISLWSYEHSYARLSYVWLGAEALIEEARNAYEAPAPVDNSSNFNGL